jgi:hypothetical protein
MCECKKEGEIVRYSFNLNIINFLIENINSNKKCLILLSRYVGNLNSLDFNFDCKLLFNTLCDLF